MSQLPHRANAASCWAILSTLIAATPLYASPPTFQVAGEQPTVGQLKAVSTDWNLTFDPPPLPGAKTIPANRLVLWGAWPEPARGAQVLLIGGGLLVGEILKLDSDNVTLDSDLFGEVALPLELAAGVILRPPSDRTKREKLAARISGGTGKTDQVLLDNGDEMSGKLLGLRDGKWEFREAETMKLDPALVTALIFNPALAADTRLKGLHAWAGFRDGSRLRANQVVLDDKSCRITLSGGVQLKCDPKSLVALQPLGGKVVYLSDLQTAQYKHIPYLTQAWPYFPDHNVLGGTLRSDGRVFLKGLGVHSAASLIYTLDAPYERFEAEIAIDDTTAGRGSVVFRVYTDDGSGQWQPRFESPVVRGAAAPLPVAVDLKGAKRLSLLVEFADRGDERDDADWLNARLIK